MGKNSLKGWRKVFSFTFSQSRKGTGTRIFSLVLLLLALCSMPLLDGLYSSNSQTEDTLESDQQIPVDGALYQMNDQGEAVVCEDSFTWDNTEYNVTYGLLMITIFLVAFCAEGVSHSVLMEKSSKIVETLLLSVSPLATIVGKILASIAILLMEFAGFGLGLVASCFLNGYLKTGQLSFLPAQAAESFLSAQAFQTASPLRLLLAAVILLTGLLFYGVLSGICGASVSRMEEIGEALKLYNLLYILGAYFALICAMASAGGYSVLNCIAYLLPVSAPFLVPAHLILGKISLWFGLCSFALLAVFVWLAFLLASRIYANMLFYNGSPMKLKDFVRFARQNGKEAL